MIERHWICADGKRGVDAQTLLGERPSRASSLPPLHAGGDHAASLRAQLAALHRRALRSGLYEHAAHEPEERLLVLADFRSKM